MRREVGREEELLVRGQGAVLEEFEDGVEGRRVLGAVEGAGIDEVQHYGREVLVMKEKEARCLVIFQELLNQLQ